MKKFFYFLILYLFVLIPVYGQVNSDVSSLVLTVNPELPQANQTITVKLDSFATDLNTASIIWYVDGVVTPPDATRKTITLNSGPYGKTKTIRVVVAGFDGRVFERTILIAPAEISLIWQAETYTPPFYKGKALFTNNADVTLIASPSSGSYSAKNLIFSWTRNGQVIENSGGLGADSVRISNGGLLAKPMVISVKAESSDGMYRAFNTVELNPILPTIRIYEGDTLLGVRFERALQNNRSVVAKETSLQLYPYFFSTPNRFFDNLFIEWSVSGQTTTNTPSITIQNKQGLTSANINAQARHKKNILQAASTETSITFSEQTKP